MVVVQFIGERHGFMIDIIVIGGGPAGLSAAISARQRNRNVAVITNDMAHSALHKAREIGNYPGLPKISGPELLGKLTSHAAEAGADLVIGRVYTVLPSAGLFNVGYGNEILVSKTVVIATGLAQTSVFPGEEKFLGNSVSYCATCDGMFFRGKRVCVVCLTPEASNEAEYLASIGCDVVRVDRQDIRINGEQRLTSVTAGGEEIPCDGVFILRQAVAPHLLVANLVTEDGFITVGASGETNIPGIFAAGDCVGTPHQIAKAVGQGQVAALAADVFLGVRD